MVNIFIYFSDLFSESIQLKMTATWIILKYD